VYSAVAQGNLIASASADKSVRIWRFDTGDCLHVLDACQEIILRLRFNSTQTLLATGSSVMTGKKNNLVKIWNTING
jgi:WD40 repeat protein